MRGTTYIVQGGQYGSEGKGQITAELARRKHVSYAVRTGSINAGHTVYRNGKKFSMQILPTPWVHEGIDLVLGAGTYIEPDILAHECAIASEELGYDVRTRLFIDQRCVWFGPKERETSQAANRHHAMGATGKGCSEAIVSKMRDRGDAELAKSRLFSEWCRENAAKFNFVDTVYLLNSALEDGQDVILEGTQGSLLDFNTGPYPFVTSRMTSSAAWLAEAGLPPVNVHTVLVVRSHPIRVAGNSGPMPGEISWPILATTINNKCRAYGLPDLVGREVIEAFENTLREVILHEFPEVFASIGGMLCDQFHLWDDQQRQEFRVCLSEANARALLRLTDEQRQQLGFFEKTTVTKKLRRIAQFDEIEIKKAVRMNAPSSIAYTFLNYDYPNLTNETDPVVINFHAARHLKKRADQMNCPILWVTTGPGPEHVVPV